MDEPIPIVIEEPTAYDFQVKAGTMVDAMEVLCGIVIESDKFGEDAWEMVEDMGKEILRRSQLVEPK